MDLKNITKKGNEGVFDSKNLALFSYCRQNPMIIIDPDGRSGLSLWGNVPIAPLVDVTLGPVFSEEGIALKVGISLGLETPFGSSLDLDKFMPGFNSDFSLLGKFDAKGKFTGINLLAAGWELSYTTPAISWQEVKELQHPLTTGSRLTGPDLSPDVEDKQFW